MVNGMVGFHCVKVRKVNIFFLGQRYKILISQLREKRDYLCCIKKIDLFTVFFSTFDRGQVRENPSTPLKRAPKKLSKIV